MWLLPVCIYFFIVFNFQQFTVYMRDFRLIILKGVREIFFETSNVKHSVIRWLLKQYRMQNILLCAEIKLSD